MGFGCIRLWQVRESDDWGETRAGVLDTVSNEFRPSLKLLAPHVF